MYRSLALGEKRSFLRYLAENYGVNQENIVQVSESIIASKVRRYLQQPPIMSTFSSYP